MAEIRIRVGASVDASVEAVFPRIEKSVQRARKNIERDFGDAVPAAMKRGAKRSEEEFKHLAEAVSGQSKSLMSPGTKAIVDFGKESQARFKETAKQFDIMAKEMERSSKRTSKLLQAPDASAFAAPAVGAGEGGRFARRVGYWGMRNFAPVTPMLSVGGRIASSLARGAGVNFDTGAMMSNYVSRQKLATDIASSGYQPGAAGAAGKLQDANSIAAEASSVAKATATDPTKALEGLQKFVAVTGDLETGRAVLGDMAKMARATGSNMEDVVTAAGEASAKLGDMPHKAETINGIMRQAAGQGKLGAVEMRDFAKQLASVAAVAPKFGGNVADNIGEMAILMQEARQHGGAKNAAQAATSVRAFVDTFSKGARLKEFNKAGIHTTNSDNTVRAPEEIILEALMKTNGSNVGMGKLFQSSQARKVTAGYEAIFNQAGGGSAGAKAVHEEFERLRKATMSEKDVTDAFNRSMETAEAKAQRFQNELQDIADRVATKVIPAMEKLAPQVERAANAFGSFIEWASENPGKAIAVALAASVAKAGIENVLRAGIERSMGAAASNGAAGGLVGKAGAVAGAGAAGVMAGIVISDMIVQNMHVKQTDNTKATLAASNIAFNEKDVAKVSAELEVQKARVNDKQKAMGGALHGADFGEMLMVGLATLTGQGGGKLEQEMQAERARDLKLQIEILQQLEKHLADIKRQGGTAAGVKADQSGRMPVAGPAR